MSEGRWASRTCKEHCVSKVAEQVSAEAACRIKFSSKLAAGTCSIAHLLRSLPLLCVFRQRLWKTAVKHSRTTLVQKSKSKEQQGAAACDVDIPLSSRQPCSIKAT